MSIDPRDFDGGQRPPYLVFAAILGPIVNELQHGRSIKARHGACVAHLKTANGTPDKESSQPTVQR